MYLTATKSWSKYSDRRENSIIMLNSFYFLLQRYHKMLTNSLYLTIKGIVSVESDYFDFFPIFKILLHCKWEYKDDKEAVIYNYSLLIPSSVLQGFEQGSRLHR